MSSQSQDKARADAALIEAIEGAVRAYKVLSPDALVIDFVVVVEGQRYQEGEDIPREQKALLFKNGFARTSVAVGLLTIGHDLLMDGERVEIEDEEP